MHERKSNLAPGMKGFFQWLAINQPGLHARAVKQLTQPSLSGLGIDSPDATPAVLNSTAPAAKSTADKVTDLVMALSKGYLSVTDMLRQKKVLDIQMQQATQGLPPKAVPAPSIPAGASPETRTMLLWGGAALGAVLLLPKFLKRGR